MALRRKANGQPVRPGSSYAQPCSHSSPSPAQSPLGLGSLQPQGLKEDAPTRTHREAGPGPLPSAPRSRTAHNPRISAPRPQPSIVEPQPVAPPTSLISGGPWLHLKPHPLHNEPISPGQAPSQHPSWKAEVAPDFLRPLRPGTRKPRCLRGSVARLYGG